MSLPPPPPREPTPQARALLFRPDARQLGWFIGGGVFLAVGLTLSILAGHAVPGELALNASHEVAQGRLMKRKLETNVNLNGRHPTTFEFAYVVNGLELSGESGCIECEAMTLERGAVVEVEYVPAMPAFARIKGTGYSVLPVWVSAFFVLPLLGAWAIWMGFGVSMRRRRAYTHGEEAAGTIESFGLDRNVQINGRNPRRVIWSFEKNGQTYKGALSRMQLPEFQAGQPVTVLHDPEDPSINVLWIE